MRGKRGWLRREGLRRRRPLTGHVGLRNRPLDDRPDRLPGLPIEDVEEPLLRRLRDDLSRLAVLTDRQQLGRLRNVPVPEIVVNELLMPDSLAGARIDRDERVGEQVVALAIAAVEVVARAAESDERDAVLLVNSELAPVVPAAAQLPMALWPRLVAELAFVRNDMEDPRELSGPHVVGMDVRGRAAVVRSTGQRDDEEVLEDATGITGPHRTCRLPIHRVAEIDTTVVAEGRDDLTVLRIHRDDLAALQVDEAAVGSIGALPVVHPARARRRHAFLAPDLLAGRGIDRGERAGPNGSVHHAVDDDGVEDAVAGDRKTPRHVELRDVLRVDLIQR